MLYCFAPKSRKITKVERKDNELYLSSEYGTLKLTMLDEEIIRVCFTVEEAFKVKEMPGIENHNIVPEWSFMENDNEVIVVMGRNKVIINKETGSCSYYDTEGQLLFKERDFESRNFDKFEKQKLSNEEQKIVKIQTADGAKDVVEDAKMVSDGFAYHTRFYVEWGDEALYGLGQHEEGNANLRGKTIYVHQGNRKIAVPMLVSTKGYGILLNTYSPCIFNDTDNEPYIYCEADSELDFYFINAHSMDGVVAGYRRLTGKAVMLPKWSLGYVQSQERYETEEEILDVAEKTREKGFGIDCVVLDWLSWGDNMWGQKTLDHSRFGHFEEMIQKLHEKHVHFMISIWPNSGDGTPNNKEFKDNGLMLPGCGVYNALSEEGRKLYWKQVCEELYPKGVDSWWCDSSEPFTPEWGHMERVEPAKLFEEYCKEVGTHLPAEQLNAFSFYHAQGIYEGWRKTQNEAALLQGKADDLTENVNQKLEVKNSISSLSERRVCNLTRSAYIGQQRFGVICWSGDIGASWKTFRNQIPAGLNFCASGLPYWTIDVGAFFVKRGNFWYWDGEFNDTTADMGYRELFTRWYQWAAFLPVFRVHGTDCRRELWNFGEQGDMYLEAIRKANELRYSLIDYMYSLAGKVWLEDKSIIRFLSFEFPQDKNVWDIKDQYMFGDSIMVCPVTTPMYYEKDNNKLENIEKIRRVYLPKGTDWYNYYTGEKYAGGQYINVAADIDIIPLFVKAGSIIWTNKPALSTEEISDELEFRVYGEGDITATRYSDAGDGYAYEEGAYTIDTYRYDSKEGKLLFSRNGDVENVLDNVVMIKY